MTQNRLVDLNNHLFEQLERLNDDELTSEELEKEIKRSQAIANISAQIVNNAKIELDATKVALEFGDMEELKSLPPMIDYGK